MRAVPVVREQRHLAVSETGKPEEAIAALEELIRLSGSTPEREGLLGGRFKKLYRAHKDAADLDRAIEHYERGMLLDLNQYYCSSNLPRLLRTRNEPGDEDRARATAHAVLLACERARATGGGDEWLNPTLLGSAFDAGDLSAIASLTRKVRAEGHATWKLKTTIQDIRTAIALHADARLQGELINALAKLEALLPAAPA
jgi:tetratricopeptide (TPR) repeat protein